MNKISGLFLLIITMVIMTIGFIIPIISIGPYKEIINCQNHQCNTTQYYLFDESPFTKTYDIDAKDIRIELRKSAYMLYPVSNKGFIIKSNAITARDKLIKGQTLTINTLPSVILCLIIPIIVCILAVMGIIYQKKPNCF